MYKEGKEESGSLDAPCIVLAALIGLAAACRVERNKDAREWLARLLVNCSFNSIVARLGLLTHRREEELQPLLFYSSCLLLPLFRYLGSDQARLRER